MTLSGLGASTNAGAGVSAANNAALGQVTAAEEQSAAANATLGIDQISTQTMQTEINNVGTAAKAGTSESSQF